MRRRMRSDEVVLTVVYLLYLVEFGCFYLSGMAGSVKIESVYISFPIPLAGVSQFVIDVHTCIFFGIRLEVTKEFV
jgi:hypothetical protein